MITLMTFYQTLKISAIYYRKYLAKQTRCTIHYPASVDGFVFVIITINNTRDGGSLNSFQKVILDTSGPDSFTVANSFLLYG